MYSPHFQAYNRNKRSMVCDLKQPARPRAVRTADRATPTSTSRISGRAPPSGSAPAPARLQRAQSAAGLLLHQRLRRAAARTWIGPATTRWRRRCRGFLSVVVDPDRPRFLGPGAGRRHHRHLRGLWRAGRAARAQPHRPRQAGRSVDARGHGAFRGRAVRRVFRARAWRRSPRDRPRLAQAYILRTADGKLIAIHLSSLEKFWLGLVDGAGGRGTRAAMRASATRLARIDQLRGAGRASSTSASARRTQPSGCERLSATTCRSRPSTASMRWSRIRRCAPRAHRAGRGAQQGGREAVRPAVAVRRRTRARGDRRAAARSARRRDPRRGRRRPALAGRDVTASRRAAE